MALPSYMRLSGRGEVRKIISSGRRRPSAIGLVISLPRAKVRGRIAITISSKIAKKSSERNKIRRQLSELARLEFAKKPLARDSVVMVSPLISSWTARILRQKAVQTFETMNVTS